MASRSTMARRLGALVVTGVALAGVAATVPGSPAAARPQTQSPRVLRPGHLSVVGRRALEWSPRNATGYQIEQARNVGMTRGIRRFTIHGPGRQFTPYALTRGTRYYFRVRTLSGARHSAWTGVVHFIPKARLQPLSVMTYNILETTNDGKHEGGGVVAPWTCTSLLTTPCAAAQTRLPKAAALIKQVHPDMIAIEEGAKWVGTPGPGGQRQVDSLLGGLGAPYALATTEIPPSQRHYFRTGVYILYNAVKYAPIGTGHHTDIGDERYEAYQEFRNIATGAKVLFIATHLLVGEGHADDLSREAETKTLISFGTALARRRHVPVVYAGDFNSASTSDKKFTLDGAGVAAREADLADALSAAQIRVHPTYNSANEYMRKPLHSNDDIDHIFAPPGVAVRSAGVEVDLVRGRFVGVIPSDHNPVYAGLLYPY